MFVREQSAAVRLRLVVAASVDDILEAVEEDTRKNG